MSTRFTLAPFIAHRGANHLAPENTLSAFRQARALNARWVEFDVLCSRDGVLCVFHDEILSRTSNGQGLLADQDWQYLKNLDAGSWFDKRFAYERIPSLMDTLKLCAALNLNINLEIKMVAGSEAYLARETLKVLAAYWPSHLHCLVSSFCYRTLQYVRAQNKKMALGFLMDEWQRDWYAKAKAIDALSVNCNYDILTPERIQAIKDKGFLLTAYTVNAALTQTALFQVGVDAVFTDKLP